MAKVTVKFDGACLGNPGPMGIGVVVGDRGVSEGIGRGTNNIAEYSAVIRGLKEAKKTSATEVTLQGDSELVIKQLKGAYKVKNGKLRKLYNEIKKLEKGFKSVKYEWVSREKNREADELAKRGAMLPG